MSYLPLRKLPPVLRDPAAITTLKGPVFGVDLEWDIRTERPTILGVSDGTKAVSVKFSEGTNGLRSLLQRYGRAVVLVGHNFLSSDLPVLESEGIQLDPSKVEDTIIWHWLNNAHLCKTTKKDGDMESDRRGAGYMNLWSMLSLYTDFWNYKDCREDACFGPCPEHDPYGYNGEDSTGPVLALPALKKQAQLLGVDKLYPLHRKLAIVLYEMRKTGILVDVPFVARLRDQFDAGRLAYYNKNEDDEGEQIGGLIPFNPDSPKQVKEFFLAHKMNLKNTQEDTIKKAVEKLNLEDVYGEEEITRLPEGEQALLRLRDYKAHGDGPDRWFKPRYWDTKKGEWNGFVDDSNFVHPHLGFYTSTARFQCSSPNMQNVPKRRKDPITGEKIGKLIRRAIIAPDGYYLAKFDYSNAENRVFLHLAGYDIPAGVDLHEWVKEIAGITEDNPLAKSQGNAREAAKTIQHAGNYLEGLQLLYPDELRTSRIRAEVAAGARLVYPSWTFQGRVVTFTGANLAKRAFGNASWENRKRALDVSQMYFGRFPKVRELQQRITRQAEKENTVRPPNGYVLRSYGYPEERCKTACATWGSQPVAHFTKLALLNLWGVKEKARPVLQVHDEVLTYVPNRIPKSYIKRLLTDAAMIEVPEIKGLKIPIEVQVGPNWGDTKTVE